jgi:hypothetical protein
MLGEARRSWLACDLLRSDSETWQLGFSWNTACTGFTAGARQIAGKVERHPGTPTGCAQNPARRLSQRAPMKHRPPFCSFM